MSKGLLTWQFGQGIVLKGGKWTGINGCEDGRGGRRIRITYNKDRRELGKTLLRVL